MTRAGALAAGAALALTATGSAQASEAHTGESRTSAAKGFYQINIHTKYSDWVRVVGKNQHGDPVMHTWNTPNDWTLAKGWWWDSDVIVTIDGHDETHNRRKTVTCDLSKAPRQGNTVKCYAF
ncbi:hypothetical protein B4N89_41385 [Embleya scabrispora]|uniref:Uncharacterized protein n=2 Tax=Embleya scabrispora TaxID=159449 RepID=A0A1T3NK75_9ACTN|nr:hypothetical protein B4N89_41385 [Embleya scabrispora]